MSDIFETGYNSSLSRSSLNLDDGSSLIGETGKYTGALGSTVEGELEATNLGSGAMASVLFTGKDTFTSTIAGYRMGIDFSTDTYKWVIGDSANHIDWNVTTANTLTITGALSASTITGGTIQTATSGQRVRIVSSSASNPTQAANSLSIVAMNGATPYSLLDMGSDGSSVFRITMNAYTTQSTGINIVRNSPTATGNLLQAEITDVSDTGNVFQLTGYGDGKVLYIRNYGEIESGVTILNAGNGSTDTYGLEILTTENSNAPGLYVEHDADTPNPAVHFNNYRNNNGSYPLKLSNQDVTLTHFKKIIEMETCTLWISDGTSPNDALGYDHIGDVCFACDSGKAYYATGGADNWTAM
jgi:hypothetical protein